jgi:Zn finger protein HypA/HybF involved in hydrogenase expression
MAKDFQFDGEYVHDMNICLELLSIAKDISEKDNPQSVENLKILLQKFDETNNQVLSFYGKN